MEHNIYQESNRRNRKTKKNLDKIALFVIAVIVLIVLIFVLINSNINKGNVDNKKETNIVDIKLDSNEESGVKVDIDNIESTISDEDLLLLNN